MSRSITRSSALTLLTLLASLGLCGPAAPASAQSVLERTPLLSGGWVGIPGGLDVSAPFRYSRAERADQDLFVVPTLEAALGLGGHTLVGARYSAQSPLLPGDAEWEVFGRFRPFRQADGAAVDGALQLGFNAAAGSVDGEATLARWIGGLRLIGAGRVFSDGFGTGEVRGALAGGALWLPAPRSLPIALAADAALPLAREEGEEVAWSGALQIGVPFSVNTLSLFATNTVSGSLQGASLGAGGAGGTRWGFELTLPIALGRILGWYPPRERALEAVVEVPAWAPAPVETDIFRHAFPEGRIVIPAGTTIRWTNRDQVVHTLSSDDGTWDSGAIRPGERWSATFNEPGIYPFHCGPHPYMKGAVIVR